MAYARFVFKRKAFCEQVLKNEKLRGKVRDACERAAGGDDRIWVRDHNGANRSGVAIICHAALEATHQTLETTLSEVHL